MGIIEIGPEIEAQRSIRRDFTTYLTIIVGVILFLVGMNIQNSTINAVTNYNDLEAGIRVNYPETWLIDKDSDEYVFRIRDMARSTFKTTIQVDLRPIGANTTVRNIADSLSVNRSQTFTDYSTLIVEPFTLPDRDVVDSMLYTFVFREQSPFLETIPIVIKGLDIFIISRGQVIIVTFRANALEFDQEFRQFERFLASLEI